MWTDPDSVVVRAAPTDTLASLDDAKARLGIGSAPTPPGLQDALDSAHLLVDGPDGWLGCCFRAWSLTARFAYWPGTTIVGLPGGGAVGAVTAHLDDVMDPFATLATRVWERVLFAVVPDRPDGWSPGTSRLRIEYVSGPRSARAHGLAREAVLRTVAALWADRADPGAGALTGLRKAVAELLAPYNASLGF